MSGGDLPDAPEQALPQVEAVADPDRSLKASEAGRRTGPPVPGTGRKDRTRRTGPAALTPWPSSTGLIAHTVRSDGHGTDEGGDGESTAGLEDSGSRRRGRFA